MSEPLIHPLKHPVTFTFNAGKDNERIEEIAEVAIRRPKGKDLRLADAQGGDMANQLKLIAQLTGLTIVQVDELDGEDITDISKVIEGFIPPGPETGPTS